MGDQVHFAIQLDNKEVTFSPNIDECSLSYELVEGYSDDVQLTFKDVVNVTRAPGYAYYTVYDREGNTFSAREKLNADKTITVPREGTLHMELIGANGYKKNETYSIDGNIEITFYIAYGRPMANVSLLQEMSTAEKARFAEIESTVKQQMFLLPSCKPNEPTPPKDDETYAGAPYIIYDTDIGSSTDDLFALGAIYYFAHYHKECNLIGGIVCRMGEEYIRLADIMNTYYGFGDIPMGVERLLY